MADVFISYASEDRERIVPIVQTIRSQRAGQVFQDYTSIVPGERWHARIVEALRQATTVVVFWCRHSAASEHVREEYQAGLDALKDMLPVLLDDTPLPDPLRAFQWIDFSRQPHGGLADYLPVPYRRNEDRHFYPFGPDGDPRDWDYEHWVEDEEHRRSRWEADLRDTQHAIAAAIVDRIRVPRAM